MSLWRRIVRKTSLVGFVVAVLLVATDVYAAAPKIDVKLEQWTLENGLRVIFVARHRIPAVTVQLWYHVGSKNERPGIRGVAHMFEHMMFKGTKHVAPEKHAQMLSALGGSVNAFTTEDVTAYHNTVPKQYLDFALQLEAERMQHLRLSQHTIASEREVVKEEKRLRLDNSPIGRAIEAIRSLAYKTHPYGWTPAGTLADLNRITPQTCRTFYRKYYVPNNATLIVVGDVERKALETSINRYFLNIPRGPNPPPVSTTEAAQTTARKQIGNWPSQLNVVLGAYHAPPASHPDSAPLTVLGTILSAGRSARLHRSLVRKKRVALGAGGFVQSFEHPGLFVIYAVGLPTHDLDTMRSALVSEIRRVAISGVTKAELNKAKNQLSTAFLGGLNSIQGLAQQIGMSTYLENDPAAFVDDLDELDAVTQADVQRVAKTFLNKGRLNLLLLPASSTSGGKTETRHVHRAAGK